MTVLVPEVHDLVLMKVARGLTHDLDAVEDVHRVRALDLETLVERWKRGEPRPAPPPGRPPGTTA